MKLLVLGSTGRVGLQVLHDYPDAVGISRAWADLSELPQVSRLLRNLDPDVVINCAAYTDVDGCEKDREKAFALNDTVPMVLAIWAAGNKKRKIIHLSTDFVFDGESKEPYKEDDTPRPINVYGESKLFGEHAILNQENGIIVRISHPFNDLLVGKEDVAKMFKRMGHTRSEVFVINRIVAFTYIPSLSKYLTDLAKQLHDNLMPSHRIYHCVCPEAKDLGDFVRDLYSGLDIKTRVNPFFHKDPAEASGVARRPKNSALAVTRYPGEEEKYKQIPLHVALAMATAGCSIGPSPVRTVDENG